MHVDLTLLKKRIVYGEAFTGGPAVAETEFGQYNKVTVFYVKNIKIVACVTIEKCIFTLLTGRYN
ncbi:hypothetical protein DXV75_15585 [Alteromonas aestuariivivens]|uniref:Uncharacterized protein n=1 Tax=Alteromonas aestuariivivens TaxID=1938339 RepID=A0A3D8M342_9ALTE|nr:hypothetical protein DXV75_15585 [Alteromonas aestuariivivens]